MLSKAACAQSLLDRLLELGRDTCAVHVGIPSPGKEREICSPILSVPKGTKENDAVLEAFS